MRVFPELSSISERQHGSWLLCAVNTEDIGILQEVKLTEDLRKGSDGCGKVLFLKKAKNKEVSMFLSI